MKILSTSSIMQILLVFLLIPATWLIACDQDDEDASDSDDQENGQQDDDDDGWGDFPVGCEGKSDYPVVLDYYLLVNGVVAEQPAIVHLDDTLVLAVDYEDADCNLKDGYLVTNTTREGGLTAAAHQYALTDIACSSAEAGEPYYQALDPSGFQFDQDVYSLYFVLVDYCEFPTQHCDLDFEVVP